MSAPEYPDTSNSDNLPDQVRQDAATLADTAKQDLASIGEEVKQEAAALGEEAKAQIGEVAGKARGLATEQKDLVARQLGSVSDAVNKVADELEQNNEATAHYVRTIANGAAQLTQTVRDNDVDQILAMAQDFGRRQPAAFMGAAALLGFVASRFVLASANRPQPAADTGSDSSFESSGDTNYDSQRTPGYDQSVGGSDAGI